MSNPLFKPRALAAALIGLGLSVGAAAQTTTPSTTTAPKAGATTGSMTASPSTTTPTAAANGKLAGADKSFVEKAAVGGIAEVELGNMAQQKAASDQVKQFAARMVTDHSKANGELKQIASAKGVQLPTAPDDKHKKDMDRLQKMSGPAFDKAYMSHMVDDHKHDVSEFKKQADSGRDADLKAFASKTLPVLQQHLQLAQTTNEAVKKGTK
jgi:putative membrane protein